MFLRGDISIFSSGRFSEIVAILTAPAVRYVQLYNYFLLWAPNKISTIYDICHPLQTKSLTY